MRTAPARVAIATLCVLPIAWGCAGRSGGRLRTPADEVARDAAPAAAGVRHVVAPGQTLWRIATAYGLSVDELARANGIDDPALLEAGAVLLVPRAKAVIDVPPYPHDPTGRDVAVRDVPESRLSWPLAGAQILSGFGAPRGGRPHQGIDIAGQAGAAIAAALDGRVVYSGSTLQGYGKTIIVDHGGGLRTLYAHGSALLVREGERVLRGQRIALVGRSGNASSEHCHFEVRLNDVPTDPLPYLDGREERR